MANSDQRFPRRERLSKRREFLEVYEKGEKAKGRYFYLYFLRNHLPYNRLGITVTRKTGGPAIRNRIKRCLREVFRRNKKAVEPFCDLVINVTRAAPKASYHSLEEEFLRSAARWREKWSAGLRP